jgi:hypothetical protein
MDKRDSPLGYFHGVWCVRTPHHREAERGRRFARSEAARFGQRDHMSLRSAALLNLALVQHSVGIGKAASNRGTRRPDSSGGSEMAYFVLQIAS